jgi:integrase
MRGSLRIRHQSGCPASQRSKSRDSRVCRCAPAVEVRFQSLGITRNVGYLAKGWRAEDLAGYQRELLEMREQLLAGRPPRPRRVLTLNDYAAGWFAQLHAAVKLGQVSPLTFNQYEGEWRRWISPRFGHLPLGAIDVPAANAYIADRLAGGAAEATAKNSLTCLSGMLTDAVAEGLIPANPLRSPRRGRHGSRRIGVDLTVRRRAPKHLELDEALALLAAVPDEHLAMPLAAMTHGLRRNELLGLQFEWIDWGSRTLDLRGQLQWVRGRPRTRWEIRDCKFKSNRLQPLYSGLAVILGRRREAEGLVFTSPGSPDQPWSETRPAQVFLVKAYADAGIRRPGVMWHALRHTYASLLGAGGIKQHEIRLLMGHKVPGTTGLYLHVMRETFDKVEVILDQAFGPVVQRRMGVETPPRGLPSRF